MTWIKTARSKVGLVHKKAAWLGLALLFFGPLLTLFAQSLPASAAASGTCQDSSCVTLIIKLVDGKGAPVSGASIKASRESAVGHDDQFSIDKTSTGGTYTSGKVIWGTNPTSLVCGANPAQKNAFFDFNISGSGITTVNLLHNNLCAINGSSTRTITLTVSTSNAPNPLGGISGTAVATAGTNCSGGAFSLTGPSASSKPIQVNISTDGSGSFDTGQTLTPGTYNISQITCTANNTTFPITYTQAITVTAAHTTQIDLTSAVAPPSGGATDPSSQTASTPTCDAGSFTWVLCPMISFIDSTITQIEGAISADLQVAPVTTGGGYASLYQAWGVFRDLATVLFVLAFFAAIFANVLGIEAYTVKKVLPRLVAAVVLVQFSYFFMQIAVDLSNVLGQGIQGLLSGIATQAIPGATSGNAALGAIELGGITVVIGAVAIAAATATIIIPLLLVVAAALIAIIGVFLTLELRLIVLQILIMVAPLAFVAWILPNTEQYFKKWWQNVLKLLLMYPMIVGLIAAASIVTRVTQLAQSSSTDPVSVTLSKILLSVIPIIIFFMIPRTFKWGGTIMGAVSGAVLSRSTALSRRAATGKAMKNAQENMQRRSAISMVEGKGKFSRAAGTILTGNLGLGRSARFRQGNDYNAALEHETKLVEADMARKGFATNNKKLKEEYGKPNASRAEKIAAMRLLGENNGIEELSSIYDGLVGSNKGKTESVDWLKEDRELWERGLTPKARAELARAVPYSVRPDGDGSILKLNAEQWVSMKGAAGTAFAGEDGTETTHIREAIRKSSAVIEEQKKILETAAAGSDDYLNAERKIESEKGNQRRLITTIIGTAQSTDRRGRNDARNTLAFKKAVGELHQDIGKDYIAAANDIAANAIDDTGVLKAVSAAYTIGSPSISSGDSAAPAEPAPAPETPPVGEEHE